MQVEHTTVLSQWVVISHPYRVEAGSCRTSAHVMGEPVDRRAASCAHRDEGLLALIGARGAMETRVAEAEDTPGSGHQPIAATVPSGRDPDDRARQVKPSSRTKEPCVAEREHPTRRSHHPVAVAARRARHADHPRLTGTTGHRG